MFGGGGKTPHGFKIEMLFRQPLICEILLNTRIYHVVGRF